MLIKIQLLREDGTVLVEARGDARYPLNWQSSPGCDLLQPDQNLVVYGIHAYCDFYNLMGDIEWLRRQEKIAGLDEATPGWRDLKYPSGKPQFAADGTMLNEDGTRSIFDDVDE